MSKKKLKDLFLHILQRFEIVLSHKKLNITLLSKTTWIYFDMFLHILQKIRFFFVPLEIK